MKKCIRRFTSYCKFPVMPGWSSHLLYVWLTKITIKLMMSHNLSLKKGFNAATQNVTFHDPGADLSSNPKLRPATLHCHQVVGLHHAGLNTLHIHRTDGPQVDHLTRRQTDVKMPLSTGNLCQITTGVFLPLPHTRFLPWREQQRHPGSDWRTESDWPKWCDSLKQEAEKERFRNTTENTNTKGSFFYFVCKPSKITLFSIKHYYRLQHLCDLYELKE